MSSLPNDSAEIVTTGDGAAAATGQGQSNLLAQIDTELVFRLIDSILPFEACLYHQIIPLTLEGSRLKLGMVDLSDSAALDYVRRILAYMNCSLAPQTISSDFHHTVLSAYLSYTEQKEQAKAQKRQQRQAAKPTAPPSETPAMDVPPVTGDRAAAMQAEPLVRVPNAEPPAAMPPAAAATDEPATSEPSAAPAAEAPPAAATPTPPPKAPPPPADDRSYQPTLIIESELAATQPPTAPDIPNPTTSLPALKISPKHMGAPVAVLATLPPRDLLHELLGRVLTGGIGRLYFERRQDHGRILWSQDGVLQSVLESIPVDLLQSVINELKLMHHLPMLPVKKVKQAEIERLYQRQRLLLRLQVMPGAHGEDATLQVLRGAALRFYQQQQLANLSRDTLGVAQQLQTKVSELRQRSTSAEAIADQANFLTALDEVIRNVEQQLGVLKALRDAAVKKEQAASEE